MLRVGRAVHCGLASCRRLAVSESSEHLSLSHVLSGVSNPRPRPSPTTSLAEKLTVTEDSQDGFSAGSCLRLAGPLSLGHTGGSVASTACTGQEGPLANP